MAEQWIYRIVCNTTSHLYKYIHNFLGPPILLWRREQGSFEMQEGYRVSGPRKQWKWETPRIHNSVRKLGCNDPLVLFCGCPTHCVTCFGQGFCQWLHFAIQCPHVLATLLLRCIRTRNSLVGSPFHTRTWKHGDSYFDTCLMHLWSGKDKVCNVRKNHTCPTFYLLYHFIHYLFWPPNAPKTVKQTIEQMDPSKNPHGSYA